jgi:hypothetical protein
MRMLTESFFSSKEPSDRMRSLRLATALAFVTTACSSPLGPGEARDFAAARAQWEHRPFVDYTFDLRRDASWGQVGPVRAIVRQGTIASATLVETGDAVDPAVWFTIEQLFDFIPHWAKSDGVDDITIRYDPTLGFPSLIQVRAEIGVSDVETFTITNVGPA